MKILEVQNLTISFENEGISKNVVNSLCFSLKAGETLGMVGESGSGKSVTCMSILKLLGPKARYKSGSVMWQENEQEQAVDLLKLNAESLRKIRGRRISVIFQEPMSALNPVLTCGFQLTEILQAHQIVPSTEYKKYTLDWFEKVGLKDVDRIYKSYPHQLSGGQLQRVIIAMALCSRPKLVIADEPTTALDVTLQKKILDLIENLKKELGISIIFISHDLSVIKNICDRIIVLKDGLMVESATTEYLFNHSEQAYTKGLINSKPPIRMRLRRLPTVQDFLNGKSMESFYDDSQIIHPTESDQKLANLSLQKPILEIQNLNVQYSIRKNIFGKTSQYLHAVANVNFELRSGEVLGIVGESGSGKSTIGRAILGLVPRQSGNCTYKNSLLPEYNAPEWKSLRKELQIIFQDPYSSLNPRKNVVEAITEPMMVHNIFQKRKERIDKATGILEKVGLSSEFLNRFPHQLSGGQRQRVCIARALVLNPKILVLDESVSALDVSVQAQTLNLLMSLKEEFGLSYLFITHDFSVVHFISDRIMVIKDGKIVEQGPSYQVIKDPQHEYTKHLIDCIP
ncbi:MAG: ABC transporter ATP-binding protein [Saprospiraceae bacterium]|nr:ABC transporter ATP-binding protein [Saprospiraceae bacterium]